MMPAAAIPRANPSAASGSQRSSTTHFSPANSRSTTFPFSRVAVDDLNPTESTRASSLFRALHRGTRRPRHGVSFLTTPINPAAGVLFLHDPIIKQGEPVGA